MKPFFQLHSGLMREGPGSVEDVLWALDVAETPRRARICDVACGPGADTVTLANARGGARVDAIDRMPHFVAAARGRITQFGDKVNVVQGDMADLTGPYDLIWCAGAVYFLGIEVALELWRTALAPGGRVAFSEPCLIAPPTPEVAEFWTEYPEISDLTGIEERVAAAGYQVLGRRMVVGDPWAAYYTPMQARINALRPSARGELITVLDEAQREIGLWRAAPDQIAYALLVVAPG